MTNKISGTNSSSVSETALEPAGDEAVPSRSTDEVSQTKDTSVSEDRWEESEEESWTDFLGSAAQSLKDKAGDVVDEVGEAAVEMGREAAEMVDEVGHEAMELVDEAGSTARKAVDKAAEDIGGILDEVEQEAIAAYEEAKVAYGAALEAGVETVEQHVSETIEGLQDTVAEVGDRGVIDYAVGKSAQEAIETRLQIDGLDGQTSFMGAEDASALQAHLDSLGPGDSQSFRLNHGVDTDSKGVEYKLGVGGEVTLARPEDAPSTYELSYTLEAGASLEGKYAARGGYQRGSEVSLRFDNSEDAHQALAAIRGGATPQVLIEQFEDAVEHHNTADALSIGLGAGVDGLSLPVPGAKVLELPFVGDLLEPLPVIDTYNNLTGGFEVEAGATFIDSKGSKRIDGELYRTEGQTHDINAGGRANTLIGLRDVIQALGGEAPDTALSHEEHGIASTTRLTPAHAPSDAPPAGVDHSSIESETWDGRIYELVETTEYRNLDTLADILPNMTPEKLAEQLESGFGYGGSRDMLVEQIIQHNLEHGTDLSVADFLTVTVEITSTEEVGVDDAAYTTRSERTRELRYTRYGDTSDDFASEQFEQVLSEEFFQDSLPRLDESRLEQQSGRLLELFHVRLEG